MRIVIAEDELLERKAMKKFIEDQFPDLKIIGEAVNGRQAIEQAKTMKPDLMFVDIKMPGINGLEAIKQIHQLHPDIKFILISAYDSFEYAQEAMHFGIKDYILKPGKKEEIIKALLRVKQEIEAEKTLKDERIHSERVMKEQLVTKAMRHPVTTETIRLQQKLFPNGKYGCFFVVETTEEQAVQMLEEAIQNAPFPIICLKNNGLIVMLAFSSTKMENGVLLTTARQWQLKLGDTCFIGIGTPSLSIEKLPDSYHTAYEACFQLKALNKRNYGFLPEKREESDISGIMEEIGEKIEKGSSNEAIFHLEKQAHLFNKNDYETLYIKISNILTSRNLSLPNQSITTLKTLHDWKTFLELCALEINDLHRSRQYISQAEAFIRANYHKPITLEDVAEMVKLSPNYFSNRFKKDFGMTFMDFLTRVRMDKAKELIEKNTYTLKEISYQVGYNNPNYFSRVFKGFYQVSPRQYQAGIFKNGRKT